MQNTQEMKLLFVVNPVSGGKEKNDWEASIRDFFKDKPQNIEFYILTGKDDMTSVKHHISMVKPDRVVAVGGDGTVKMLAELVKETNLPMGIIPAGSANGMAKELQIPDKVEEALQIITDGQCRKLDVIRINEEHICIHLSDIGLNALLVRYFEKSKKRGMWGYGQSVLKVLWNKRKMYATIKTDDKEIKRNAYMVVLANARKYGTGANINPDGDVSDGKFEVVIVRKLNLLEITKAIFTERSFHPKRIEVLRTKTLEMTLKRQSYFQVDGEYLGKTASVKAHILPQIVYMMLPAPAAT